MNEKLMNQMSDAQLARLVKAKQDELAANRDHCHQLRRKTESLRSQSTQLRLDRTAALSAEETARQTLLATISQHQAVLSKVRSLTERILSRFSGDGGESGGGRLLDADMGEWMRAEASVSEEIATLIQRQFPSKAAKKGTVEGSGDEQLPSTHLSHCSILQILDPEALLVQSESAQTRSKQELEWNRLQKLYIKTELESLQAHMHATRSLTLVEEFSELTEADAVDTAEPVRQGLWTQLQHAESLLASAKTVTAEHTATLSTLLQKIVSARSASLLCGEYDLKMARLNYACQKLEGVIEHLSHQQSRAMVLRAAVCREVAQHKAIARTAGALEVTLCEELAAQEGRMQAIHALQAQATHPPITALHTALYTLLSPTSATPPPDPSCATGTLLAERAGTLSGVVGDGERATERGVTQRDAVETSIAHRNELLLQALTGSTAPHNSVPSDVLPGVLVAESEAVSGLITELDVTLRQLEADFTQKKEHLTQNTERAVERDLFQRHFAEPERVCGLVDAARSRLAHLSADS